ncbi:MFS transporter [Thermobifida cellulosilytica]|uniref:MFS transporter n=1 Tax=Thermobifida cellulosilytica TB100 TaxID=665004 RepID=A0A147KEF9_THECS|nr:MFS transporter [Thermobifida cellulosilytica]KUP95696.1 MFS transporter [Thermobifida cellulosilytica TB100]
MPAPPLPASVRLGYGLGSIATGTYGTVPGLVLLYYLTDVLAVPAATAALVLFVPRVWDVLVDPWVGALSDRTRSSLGPRRPWLLAGALTLPVTFAAIFLAPPLSGGWAAGYVCLLLLAAATAFSLFQVPYVAMPAEMTDDHRERSRLMSWRMALLGAAILLSGGVAPAVAQSGGGTPAGYRLMALVVGALLLAGTLSAFLGTRRAPLLRLSTAAAPRTTLRDRITAVRANRPFRVLFAAFLLQAVPAGIMLAAAQYFATYTLGSPSAVTTLFVCLVGPLVLTMPLWLRGALRHGKRAALGAAAVLFGSGAALLAATPLLGAPFDAWYAHVCVGLVGVGYAGTQLLPFAMLTDTLAADAARSGASRAGLFTGLWTAGETLAMATGSGLFALLLAATGFVSSTAGTEAAQPASALAGIVAGISVLPALLVLASIPFVRRYDLAEEDPRPDPPRTDGLRPGSDAGTPPPATP